MPAYNAERYIDEAIGSILRQTFADFELIIVDDCSDDATLDIIRSYAAKDSRIIYRSMHRNLNTAGACNFALRLARGMFIARMDADDIAVPTRLEQQVRFLRSHPEVGMVGSNMIMINHDNMVIGHRKYPTTDTAIRKRIFRSSPFCHPSIMVRKTIAQQVGCYNEKLVPAEDYDFFFRIGGVSKFSNLDEWLCRYRIHASNISFGTRQEEQIRQAILIRRKYYRAFRATCADRLRNALLYVLYFFLIPLKTKARLFLGAQNIRI